MFNWLTNKKTRLRFKRNWSWVARAEKVDALTVRLVSKRPTPFAVARLARTPIFPQHVHAPLKKKNLFGTKPVGTGMYRATQVDRNKGVVMVKNPAYKHGGKGKPASNIGRAHVLPVTDVGTQIAQMLAGNIEITRALTFDEASGLGRDPRYNFTLAQSLSYIYMYFDTANRSGIGVFGDKRVREALAMAVNRDLVPTVRSGKKKLPRAIPNPFAGYCRRAADFPPSCRPTIRPGPRSCWPRRAIQMASRSSSRPSVRSRISPPSSPAI